MAETRVALPEPRPEDDEDVVWGLSTAKALWARGERADALVWLRRAAEAAESAGQSFRSSEIGLYVSELEDAVAATSHEARAPMHASLEIEAPVLPPIARSDDPDGGDTIADATVAAAQLEIRRRIDDDEETLVRRHPQTSQPPAGAPQLAGDAQSSDHHAQVLPPPPGSAAPAAHPAFGAPPMDASNARSTQPYVAPAIHASPFGPPLQARSASPMPPPQSAPPMHAYGPPQMHPPPMHPQSAPPVQAPMQTPSARPVQVHSAPPVQAHSAPPHPHPRSPPSAPPLRAAPANVPRTPPSPVVTSYVASAPPAPPPPTRSSAPVPAPVPSAQPMEPPAPPRSSAPPAQQPSQASKASAAPAAGSAAAAAQPTAPGLGPTTANEARAEAAPSTKSSSQLAPDSEPPVAVRPGRQGGAVSPTPAPPPAAQPQKKRRRAPILDPWSEPEAPRSTFLTRREARASTEARASDPKLPELARAPDARVEASGPRPEPGDVELREDAVVVSVRSRPLTLPEDDDDEVVTSAVPLDALRRRSARVPPPPPPAARAKPPESAGEASPEPLPPPLVSAPPPPPKGATPPPPPPLLSASVPPAGSSPEVSARAAPPAARGGQFTTAEPLSARAKLAADAEPIASKAPGGASPQRGPHVPIAQRTVGGLPLDHAGVLAELPHELQVKLAAHARVERLGPDEEVSGFGIVLVVDGDAFVSATIVDAPAHRLQAGALVPSRGNLGDAGVAVRVVGGASGARVAVWDASIIEPMLRGEPAIASELRDRADRLQALAGTTLGPLGEIDETYRNLAVERLTVKLARPGEVLAAKGTPMRGLAIVAAGSVEVDDEDGVRELGPGELLFPDAVLRALPAPANVRASETGALLLVGERRLAEELMVTVPPLVEILSA